MAMTKYIYVLLLIFLMGCSQSGVIDSQATLMKMEKAGNVTGMIGHYKTQLKAHPDDPALLKALAQLYYQIHDLESAIFYADHYGQVATPDKDIWYLKGKIYDDLGDYSVALAAFKQAETLGEVSPAFSIRYGIVLSKVRQYTEAEAQFNLARLRGDDDITIKNNLAVLYLMQEKYSDAVAILQPIFPHAKDNNTLAINLAVALIKQGKDKQAYDILKPRYSDAQLQVLFQVIKDMEHV